MSIKPGWETTEFWATVFAQIVGLGLAMGILSPAQASAAASHATSVGGVAVMLLTLLSYMASRTIVKHQAVRLAPVPDYAQHAAPPVEAPAPPPVEVPAPLLDSPIAPSYGPPRAPITAPITVTLPTASV